MRFTAILFIFIFGLFIVTNHTQAQPGQIDTLGQEVGAIAMQPEFPKPGEPVTVTLSIFGSDFRGGTITWLRNGQEITEAKNQREINFTAGRVGTSDIFTAILTSNNGINVMLEAVATPVYLDIVLEPQTRVPAFYQGRALPSVGSVVNATALINGQARNDLVYTWKIDQKVVEDGPIRGRNQVSFTIPMGSSPTLSLTVARFDGSIIASRSIFFPSVLPTLSFYEVNTLFGISNRAITRGYNLISQSATIQAEPYYLDSRSYNNPDVKEWKVNGRTTLNNNTNPYQITLQRAGTSGTTRLEFHVRDLTQVLQGDKATVDINY